MAEAVTSNRQLWADLLQDAKQKVPETKAELLKVQKNAFSLANAIGHCLRWGISVSNEDFQMLTPTMANAAILELKDFISRVKVDLSKLEEDLDEARDPSAEEICVELLDYRESVAAVFEAVTQVYTTVDRE